MKLKILGKPDPSAKQRMKCRRKFLHYFKKGFNDPKYIDWERQYKLDAHFRFQQDLNRHDFENLLQAKKYSEIASAAVRIESRTNLLFSFEKMALRDAIKIAPKDFANGLFQYVYGSGSLQQRFELFSEMLLSLPRKQTRVFTWPLQTVFGFIGNPQEHIFLKPTVTRRAAEKYGFAFDYKPGPNWQTYQSLLAFAAQIRRDNADLQPADFIDLQSFIWVMGSDEYPD